MGDFMCDDEFDRQGGRGMKRSRGGASDWDDRPHDWDREGRRGCDCEPDDRGGRPITQAPGPEGDFRNDPRYHPSHREQPGPDGVAKPPYTGPRNTEQYLVREWQVAYEQACCEVRVEILKERIRKTWGKNIAKVAEELDNLMYKDWQLSQKDGDHSKEREKLLAAFAKTVIDSYKKGPK